MTEREKLIELIGRFCTGLFITDITSPYGYENLADYLIAHGVTVQQWIPVSERLPEEDGYYLCYVRSCLFQDRRYLNILKCDKYGFSDGAIYTDNVTHWMPPPEPPKEE